MDDTERLARIDVNVENLVKAFDKHTDDDKVDHDNHYRNIGSLNKNHETLLGKINTNRFLISGTCIVGLFLFGYVFTRIFS